MLKAIVTHCGKEYTVTEIEGPFKLAVGNQDFYEGWTYPNSQDPDDMFSEPYHVVFPMEAVKEVLE
jgi:hypothetical protein